MVDGGGATVGVRLEPLLTISLEGGVCLAWRPGFDELFVGTAAGVRVLGLGVGGRLVDPPPWGGACLVLGGVPPARLAPSPDGRLLAVSGRCDTLVRVFDVSDQATLRRFCYLVHPAPVRALVWRAPPPPPAAPALVDAPPPFHVLLTSAGDDVHRMWVESPAGGEGVLQFALAGALEAAPGAAASWLRRTGDVRESGVRRRAVQPQKSAVTAEDWIVGFEPSGAVILWGVQHLSAARLPCMPTAFVWSRVEEGTGGAAANAGGVRALLATGEVGTGGGLESVCLMVLSDGGRMASWRLFLKGNLASNGAISFFSGYR